MVLKSVLKPGGDLAHLPLDELVLDIKKRVIRMADAAGGGYVGQGLCSAEMIGVLFFRKLRLDPSNPNNPNRDRFLLSTGHYAISVYAALAKLGFFKEELLDTYSGSGTLLELIGSEVTPGMEIGGGSLGQGLSRGVGHALAAKMRNHPWKVYVYMSDGELEEGQVWEAAMTAAHHELDNLLLIIDFNGYQVDGRIDQITSINPLVDKWQSFNWNVLEINGNDLAQVMKALNNVPENGKPTVIISHTIMGNGVSFLHGRDDIHYVKWTKADTERALQELT